MYKKRSASKHKYTFAAAAAALAMMLTGCADDSGSSQLSGYHSASQTVTTTTASASVSVPDVSSSAETTTTTTTTTSTTPAPAESIPDEPKQDSVVHLCCAGDNLIHDNIYEDARKPEGGFDFSKCYAPCKRLIEGADLAILNQETVVNSAFPPSTYPMFSTPTENGDAVIDFGFNVISMSNNHVLDMGSKGLISSLDYWDSKGILHYGAYRSEADADDIKVKEINGIKFAFLGYMEHTNGMKIFSGQEGKVIYIADENKIKEQIEKADKLADVVVVSCHYGTEVLNELNDMQKTLTPKLVSWGADLIIGTQAHALSTCTYLDKPDGGKAFVFYGLGNFFSTMGGSNLPDGQHAKPLVGIFGSLDVRKSAEDGSISFENIKATPVISHFEGKNYHTLWYNCSVWPLADYTDEMLQKHFIHQYSGITREEIEGYLKFIPDEFLDYKKPQ